MSVVVLSIKASYTGLRGQHTHFIRFKVRVAPLVYVIGMRTQYMWQSQVGNVHYSYHFLTTMIIIIELVKHSDSKWVGQLFCISTMCMGHNLSEVFTKINVLLLALFSSIYTSSINILTKFYTGDSNQWVAVFHVCCWSNDITQYI